MPRLHGSQAERPPGCLSGGDTGILPGRMGSPSPAAPPAKALGRFKRGVLGTLASVFSLGCAATLPPALPPALPAERRPPVLLVHGIDDDHRTLAPVKAHLLARGFSDVEAIDLVPNDGSAGIPALAEQVRDAALALRARTGAERVDVVAFSMGSLVTRYWLMRGGGQAAVRRFVSISGPHHGTLLAFFRANEGARQMRPDSPLLRDLARDEGEWGGVEAVSLWTPLDLMIVPPASSRLRGARHRAFPVVAHPLMLHDPRVLDAVTDALSGAHAQVPGIWSYPDWP